ncbi:MAG: DNA cytosine methyltransferase [Ktedonobacteraceae bacterium]|nr:DNA cytosine methyltransferase [Ktedonobacteraceae bacterium]
MLTILGPRRGSGMTNTSGYCGAGGIDLGFSWTGIELKLGMNHNELSLATHQRNFPQARHDCIDIQAVPDEEIKLFPATDFSAWGAECKYQSTASGEKLLHQGQRSLWSDMDEEKPHVERSRATMREVVRWATAMSDHHTPYRAILVENVPEVMHWWGIKKWYQDMYALGYRCQTICFNSMFAQATLSPSLAEQVYPVAQNRNRWYTICTQQGNPAPDVDFRPRAWCHRCSQEVEAKQVWKECARERAVEVIGQVILWGDYGEQYVYFCPTCDKEVVPYFTPASAMLDWSLPIQQIGMRDSSLAENTVKRINKGLQRFYCDNSGRMPFLMNLSHTESDHDYTSLVSLPMHTQDSSQTTGVVIPSGVENPEYIFHILPTSWEIEYKIQKIREQKTRQGKKFTMEAKEQLIASIEEHYRDGVRRYLDELPVYLKAYREPPPLPPSRLLERGFIASYYNGSDCLAGFQEPIRTIDSHDRHGICLTRFQKEGMPHLDDCYYRMLHAKEVKRAMGIPESYIIEATSQREEVRQCGLAVTPAVATLLMLRVLASLGEEVICLECA